MIHRATACFILAILAAGTWNACTLDRGPAPVVPATPIPTFTPAPRLIPTPSPTPVTSLGQTEVERLVWEETRSCTDQIARPSQSRVEVAFTATYEADTETWLVQALSQGLGLSFGLWEVTDSTGLVRPRDEVARTIASHSAMCEPPVSFLAGGLTPPLFSTSAATPGPGRTPGLSPTPTASLDRAGVERLVWQRMRSCADQVARSYQSRVEVEFAATYEEETKMWLVAASSPGLGLSFGRWEVTDATGQVRPLDEAAQAMASDNILCERPMAFLAGGLTSPLFSTPAPTPGPGSVPAPGPTPTATPLPALPPAPTPVVATGEQARLRVWVAVRSCFSPVPAFGSFSAYQDSPHRWIVEGRGEITNTEGRRESVTYGLWTVDAGSGEIIPSDQLAVSTAARSSCFQRP